MKCPVCSKDMRVAGSDESNNPKTGITYDRKIYVCDGDDVWVTVEIPKPDSTAEMSDPR